MIWEDGSLTQEIAVISGNMRVYGGRFADKGDSGSLVVTMDTLKAVGLVVAKNASIVPWWVAVTPLSAVLKDVKDTIGEEVEFCQELFAE